MNTQDSKIPQSNSQIKREARLNNQGRKNFGGKTSGFADNRERHFYQRMLKAYLRGDKTFQFGMDDDGKRKWFDVVSTDKTVDAKALDQLLANGYTDPGKVFGGVKPSKKQLNKIISDRIEAQHKAKNPAPKKKSLLDKIKGLAGAA